jgi:hypothetical protein
MTRLIARALPVIVVLAACGGHPLSTKPNGAAGQGGGSPGAAGSTGQAGTGDAGSGAVGTGTAGATAAGGAGATGGSGESGGGGATGDGGATGGGAIGGSPGTGGIFGASLAVCDKYCTAITAACVGVNAQYADKPNCMKVCSHLPPGSPTDANGDTIGCRINSATAALAATTAVKQSCWAAGPFGFGTCGAECDILCSVVLRYCSATEGYTGVVPYASLDECNTDCGNMSHQVDPTMPGIYSANYTPGPTPDSKDTNDCRAYQLFIKAMGSEAGAQARYCPNAANNSPACGPGFVPPVIADGGLGNPDAAVPTYDGGPVNIINGTNWDETKYPPSNRKMLLRDWGDPHLVVIDLSKAPALQWKTVAGGPWARAMQLIGNNQILGGRNDGYEVFDYTTGAIVKTVNTFANTQSVYRLATGATMLTTSGTVLKFLDKDDKLTQQISYPGYGFVRIARPTRKGTFLVPSDQTVFEGDTKGNVLWKVTAGSAGWASIWEPLLDKDGDVLLATGFGASCDVIDHTTHMVTKRYGTKQVPNAAAIRPNEFDEFEILPNGNIVTSNSQGHGAGNGGTGIQVIEFNPAGDVVWFYKQDPTIFSSIAGVMVLDGKDPHYLHAQEISPDSTWQPVIPTP